MIYRNFVIFVLVVSICGCVAPSSVYHSSSALSVPMNSSVLILPPDVLISLLNAGGNAEPRSDWSKEVQASLEVAIQGHLYQKGVRFIPYGKSELTDNHVGILRQANVLMDAIELSQVKQGITSERIYAFGKGSLEDLKPFDADYALVTVLRANKASGGRTAVAILGAFAGATIETNTAEFRVGLFDLRDGQLKWANFDPLALADIGNVISASEKAWEKAITHILVEIPL